jgi:hypothetical protein
VIITYRRHHHGRLGRLDPAAPNHHIDGLIRLGASKVSIHILFAWRPEDRRASCGVGRRTHDAKYPSLDSWQIYDLRQDLCGDGMRVLDNRQEKMFNSDVLMSEITSQSRRIGKNSYVTRSRHRVVTHDILAPGLYQGS